MAAPVFQARVRITNEGGIFDTQPAVPGPSARIKFTATRSLAPSPNTAKIEIFNLAAETVAKITGVITTRTQWSPEERAELLAKGASAEPYESISEGFGLANIELSWGFTDGTTSTVGVGYRGQSDSIRVVTSGLDQILTIEALDGGHLLGAAEVMQESGGGLTAKSYSTGTSVSAILADLFNAAGLDADAASMNALLVQALSDRGLPTSESVIIGGYSASGPVAPQIDGFLRPMGLLWSVQNGVVSILTEDGLIPGETELELRGDNGTIFGTPQRTEAGLVVSSWAHPASGPGRQVTVKTFAPVTGLPVLTYSGRSSVATTTGDTYSGGAVSIELTDQQTIPGVF